MSSKLGKGVSHLSLPSKPAFVDYRLLDLNSGAPAHFVGFCFIFIGMNNLCLEFTYSVC